MSNTLAGTTWQFTAVRHDFTSFKGAFHEAGTWTQTFSTGSSFNGTYKQSPNLRSFIANVTTPDGDWAIVGSHRLAVGGGNITVTPDSELVSQYTMPFVMTKV